MRWLFYIRMPVLTYGASAICLVWSLFFKEAGSRDPVVPVCHHLIPALGILVNCTILVTLSYNTLPMPMTVLLGAGTLCALGKETIQDILWLPNLTG
jgi:hypothetical protein